MPTDEVHAYPLTPTLTPTLTLTLTNPKQERLRAAGKFAQADLARSKMDCVRAQQLENWQNQRNIAQENRASGAG